MLVRTVRIKIEPSRSAYDKRLFPGNIVDLGPELDLDRRNGYRHPVETLGEADLVLKRGPEMGEKGWFGKFAEWVGLN